MAFHGSENSSHRDNNILTHISDFLTEDPISITSAQVLDLRSCRKSPSPGADATKPKYQLITPTSVVYFKFGLTDNEICAEIVSFMVAEILQVPVTKTFLAIYKSEIGVASCDNRSDVYLSFTRDRAAFPFNI